MEYNEELILEYFNEQYLYDRPKYTDNMIEKISIVDNMIIIRILDDYVKIEDENTKGYGLQKSKYITWLRSKKLKKIMKND